MNFQGREIDPVGLWERWVDFPPNTKVDGEFLPLVFCPNPDHDNSRTPAFQINAQKGLVHCFGQCGISGTYTRAISIIEGISEREARKIILRDARMGRKKIRSKRNGDRNKQTRLGSNGSIEASDKNLEYNRYIPQIGAEYLASRGILQSSVAHYEIGWDQESQRIVIPARDINGTIRLLIKRAVMAKQRPKYLYTEGFPKTSLLFGACDIDPGMVRSQGLVLVEGSIDRIILWQHGIYNTLATLGTGLSEIQARIVARLRPSAVYLMFDRDISGISGIEMARRRLPKTALRVSRYPSGKFDPAELTREEAYRSIKRAVPVSKILTPSV